MSSHLQQVYKSLVQKSWICWNHGVDVLVCQFLLVNLPVVSSRVNLHQIGPIFRGHPTSHKAHKLDIASWGLRYCKSVVGLIYLVSQSYGPCSLGVKFMGCLICWLYDLWVSNSNVHSLFLLESTGCCMPFHTISFKWIIYWKICLLCPVDPTLSKGILWSISSYWNQPIGFNIPVHSIDLIFLICHFH